MTTAPQTLTIGNPANNTVLTNFQNQPLAPALQLFDPTLGTLTAVTETHAAVLQSRITATNLSQSSGTTITANLNGNYAINGLNQTIAMTVTAPSQSITVPAFDPSNPSASTATFQPLLATDPTPPTPPTSVTFTDPASLQFFTASANRTSITPTMTANGSRRPARRMATTPRSSLPQPRRRSPSATRTSRRLARPSRGSRGPVSTTRRRNSSSPSAAP